MRALVTGATGFLGRKLAERLLAEGWEVTALGRNAVVGAELEAAGMRFVRADLQDAAAVDAACRGVDHVFHSGALSSPWGPYESFFQANVVGTRHVVAGCRAHGVKRLIHVSTPSLYFDFNDRLNIREDDPLPARFVNAYAETKRLAELEVDRAFAGGLPAITIRPRALFGPGDTTIMPRLIRAAEKGFLPLFGDGGTMIDVTYVENVVDALLLCQRAPESALGKKYNITNGEPQRLVEFLPRAFDALGLRYVPLRVPFDVAMGLATTMEIAARTLGRGQEPLLTRYAVGLLGKSQTLDITAARQALGYSPRVSVEEGIQAYASWWKARR